MEETEIKKVSPYSMLVKVLKLEEDFAKLQVKDLDKVCDWPRKMLPAEVKEGDNFYVRLGNKETLEEEYQEIARKVLEEMLN